MIAREKLDLMLPANRARIEAEDKALDAARKPDSEREKMLMASASSPAAAIEFAAGRQTRINVDIDADILASQLFETETLKDDQWPEVYTEKNQKYEVKEISQLGGAPKDSFTNEDGVTAYKPYYVSSDLIDYPTASAVTGRLKVSDRVNKRASKNVASKINQDIWTLIKSIYGTFPTGTFNTDSDVVSFPTTNSIDASAQGGITINTMKSLFALSLRLGIKINKIYLSPTTLPEIWDWVPVYNAAGSPGGYNSEVPLATQQLIMQNGVVNNLFGYNVTWIVDNTLEVNRMYCFSDQPVGKYSKKPSQDKTMHFNEIMMKVFDGSDHKEAVQITKCLHLLIPAPYRKNTIRVITNS